MNRKRVEDRFDVMGIILAVVFGILAIRIAYMTIVKGDSYYEEAQNRVYRNIPIEAPRGEIRDRYGRLLAGNRPSFTVQISKGEVGKDKKTNVETAQKLMKILKENQESYVDEFPITFANGKYQFTYTEKINEWKTRNSVPLNYNAKESFYYLIDTLNSQGVISTDPSEEPVELQKKLNSVGYYPPIYVSRWQFAEEVKRDEWLAGYRIKNFKISPQKAYQEVRDYYEIPKDMSKEEARDILVVLDLMKSKGYLQYQPVKVALDVSQKTAAKIEELGVELPGVRIEVEPIRYYPNQTMASHILGQIGKIAQQEELDKYKQDRNYSLTDMVGKTGIEKKFEDKLHGTKGYKRVQVDSGGRLVKKMEIKSPNPGSTVYLTIDKDLQKVAEDSLKTTLETIQAGGVYQSKWGNVRLRDNKKIFRKATSGAVVAVDIKTGQILAMASYPDYDPNLFATGINSEAMKELMPKNENDPLAPKPLYNVATMTSVQPGSTFKMITGLAAVESGMDPNYRIPDKGYIQLGNRKFGCWKWNEQRATHGAENLMDAIRDSCNYYFYSVSTSFDYARNKPLNIKMDANVLLDYTRMFGLDDRTGIEIEEIPGKVPNPERKLETTKRSLYYTLARKMGDYFIDVKKGSSEYEEKINTIVSWTEENPSRGQLIERLTKLKVKEEYVLEITDLVKFDYFNQATWKTGDTFNLSIGQGEHAYTPLQMANYISAVVNGGYLNKITLIDKIESYDKLEVEKNKPTSEKIPLKDDNNLNYLTKGMLDVTQDGTAKALFGKFPVKVGAKTGTAQKSGRIPLEDEEAYLISHLSSFRVNKNEVLKLAEKYEKQSKEKLPKYLFIRKAIMDLNPKLTLDEINRFKDTYDPFSWFVSYAPYDKPEIAVISMIFQGGHGAYAAPVARDIMAEYFGLNDSEIVNEQLNIKEEVNR